jgi:hypothetical protein
VGVYYITVQYSSELILISAVEMGGISAVTISLELKGISAVVMLLRTGIFLLL